MAIHQTMPPGFSPKMQVSACYLEHDDRILLLLRQDYKPQGNTWCLPGGKLDPGDTPLDAVVREVYEETAIELQPKEVAFFRTLYVKFPEMYFIYHLFHSKLAVKPEVQISPQEHKDYCWPTPRESLTLNLILKEEECIKMYYHIL